MRENLELIKKEVSTIKELCGKQLGIDSIMEMSADDLAASQCAIRMVDAAMKFTEAQVEAMERLEQKLDKLLAKE